MAPRVEYVSAVYGPLIVRGTGAPPHIQRIVPKQDVKDEEETNQRDHTRTAGTAHRKGARRPVCMCRKGPVSAPYLTFNTDARAHEPQPQAAICVRKDLGYLSLQPSLSLLLHDSYASSPALLCPLLLLPRSESPPWIWRFPPYFQTAYHRVKHRHNRSITSSLTAKRSRPHNVINTSVAERIVGMYGPTFA